MTMFTKDHNFDRTKFAQHHQIEEDKEDEEEETLSFCDLPMNSDSVKWEDESSTKTTRSDHTSSFDDDEDLFEFFSHTPTHVAASSSPNNNTEKHDVVFCGKVIPYKGREEEKPKKIVKRLVSFEPENNDDNEDKSRVFGSRVSWQVMIKPKWYLYAFGMTRFPTKMELRDMRTRQTRRRPQTTKENASSKWLWWALGCGGGHVTKLAF